MALVTTIEPWHIAVALGQPAPPAGRLVEERWEMWISDALMFIQDRATKLGVDDAEVDQAKIDFVIRRVVADQVKLRDTDVDAEDDGQKFTTVADWWPLLGLTGTGSGAYSVDMIGGAYSHLPWCASMFGAAYCSCGVDIAGYPIYEVGETL